MVYQGPSKACARCKQRHIKCDETRPSCRNCLKRQLPCPGYAPEPGIRFQDETTSTINQAQQRERRPVRKNTAKSITSVPPAVSQDGEAIALQFFFDNYATLGRGFQSSQGFFEMIVPIYSSAAPSSAMHAATSAVALTLTSEWHGMINEAPLARRHLGKALSLLRLSLNDPVLSLNDDTMMAVLLLKFHDMLVASKHLKEIPEEHVNGAIALIKHRGLSSFNTDISKRLLQYVRHTAITCALQQRTKLDKESELWTDPESMLKTPCIDLDWIAVDVANLRASAEVRRILHYHPAIPATLDDKQTRDVRHVREQAEKLEIRLTMWAEGLCGRWRPAPVPDPRGVDPSILTAGHYGRECHVYPSAQITNTWNLFRSYSFLVAELLLRCEILLEPDAQKPRSSDYARVFQETVDDLCASIPFLLGNRTEPGTIEEFHLPNGVRFLKHPDDGRPNSDNLEMDMFMTEDQRTKSLLAQGPWLLHEYLEQVVRFVTSDIGEALAPLIRPQQLEWMQEQMRRIMRIQRIEGKGKGPELKNKRSSGNVRLGIGVGISTDTDSSANPGIESSTARHKIKQEQEDLEEGV